LGRRNFRGVLVRTKITHKPKHSPTYQLTYTHTIQKKKLTLDPLIKKDQPSVGAVCK
jgi:hypothetical protein